MLFQPAPAHVRVVGVEGHDGIPAVQVRGTRGLWPTPLVGLGAAWTAAPSDTARCSADILEARGDWEVG